MNFRRSLVLGLTLITAVASAAPPRLPWYLSEQRNGIMPGRVLVKMAPNAINQAATAPPQLSLVPNGIFIRQIGSTGWTVWEVPVETDTVALAASLAGRPGVIMAQPANRIYPLVDPPNDGDYGVLEENPELYGDPPDGDPIPRYMRLWNLDDISALAAWNVWPNQYYTAATKPKNDPLIAIIDTGCDMDHPDLRNSGGTNTSVNNGGQLNWDLSAQFYQGGVKSGGTPMDRNGHGTHVAGLAVGAANNGSFVSHGILGTGYNATAMILRVFDDGGVGDDSDAAAAMIYAVDNGAKIINLSLGTENFSQVFQDATTYAYQKGAVVVAACNESGSGVPTIPIYPAGCSGAFAVTAAGPEGTVASFAGTGNYISIAAPGGDVVIDFATLSYKAQPVWSLQPQYTVSLTGQSFPIITTNYAYLLGTSMASPQVAGAAALFYGKNKLDIGGWNNRRVMNVIERSAFDVFASPYGSWGANHGFGIMQMDAMLAEGDTRAATAGAVSGIIYKDSIPLANAPIWAVSGSKTVKTSADSKGIYRFSALGPGTWQLQALPTTTGYTKVRNVIVKSGAQRSGEDFWSGIPYPKTDGPTVGYFELASTPTLNQVAVRHWAFDSDVGLDKVTWRLGTTQGGTQVKADFEVIPDGDTYTISGLNLANGQKYWLRGIYKSNAGASTTVDLSFFANTTVRQVNGNVALGDWTKNQAFKPVTFEIRNHSSGSVLDKTALMLDSNGNYHFTTQQSGNVDIVAQVPQWLSRNRASVNLAGASVTGVNFSLYNGDIDLDNQVTIIDYSIFSDYYDLNQDSFNWLLVGSNGFRPKDADVDGDGAVTIVDYGVISDNYDRFGE